MDEEAVRRHAADVLKTSGARFAFVFGSRAKESALPGSDLDIAAWWALDPPLASDVLMGDEIDLLVLNDAPLELAGRVAVDGQLLFDDDPPARVHWVADTRKIYFDELPRLRRYERELRETLAHGR